MKRKPKFSLDKLMKLKKLEMQIMIHSKNVDSLQSRYPIGAEKIGNLIVKKCQKTVSDSSKKFQTFIKMKNSFKCWKTRQITPRFNDGNKTDLSRCKRRNLLYYCSEFVPNIVFDELYTFGSTPVNMILKNICE